jgi:hypothetical protein
MIEPNDDFIWTVVVSDRIWITLCFYLENDITPVLHGPFNSLAEAWVEADRRSEAGAIS